MKLSVQYIMVLLEFSSREEVQIFSYLSEWHRYKVQGPYQSALLLEGYIVYESKGPPNEILLTRALQCNSRSMFCFPRGPSR